MALHTVADLYPDTKVWGVDYWPHQMLWVPKNLTFILDDVELEWLKSTFDADRRLMYIHAREMVLAITDQSRFLDQAFRCESPSYQSYLIPFGVVSFKLTKLFFFF